MPVSGQYRYSEGELPQKPQKIELKMPGHKFKNVLSIILLAAIIFGAYIYWPQLTNAYEIVKNSTVLATQPIMQIFNPEQTIKQYQDIWGSTTVKEQEKKVLNVEFLNPISQTPLSIIAKINVNAAEDMTLNPKCYLDGNGIETEPDKLSFLKSDLEQHSSIKCLNSVGGKDLSVKIETPLKVKSILTLWAGKGENKGILKSEMDHSSAYSVLLTTVNDQPLANGEYPLIVRIKRENSKTLLTRIDSFKISTFGSTLITCPTISGNREAFSKYLVDKSSETYIIECNIEVNGEELLQRSFIESELDYAVEEEFKTTLAQ